MHKDDFNIVLSSLEKSSERTRSTYYVFIILNLAGLFYAIGAYLLPLPLERMNVLSNALKCQIEQTGTPECKSVLSVIKISFSENNDVREYEKEKYKYILRSLVEERASQRKFNLPILGFSVDIDYFGIIFAIFGPILYLILISNISNETEQFFFAADNSSSNSIYLRSILSTQVLSASDDFRGKPIIGFHKFIRNASFSLIAFMPIFTCSLSLARNLYLNDLAFRLFSADAWRSAWQHLLFDLTTIPLLTISQILTEIAAIVIMFWMFLQLRLIAKHMSRSYQNAWATIRKLEASAAS